MHFLLKLCSAQYFMRPLTGIVQPLVAQIRETTLPFSDADFEAFVADAFVADEALAEDFLGDAFDRCGAARLSFSAGGNFSDP